MLQIETPAFHEEALARSHIWDREWCRYFTEPYAKNYFYDMSDPNRQLSTSTEELKTYSARDFYFANVFGIYAPHVWIAPYRVIGRNLFELGCGPGTFAKIAGKLCSRYHGVDYSRLALYIASILSPSNCSFLHVTEKEKIISLRRSIDTVVSQHFFIHQNLLNVRWILELFAHVLRVGGQAVLDFWPYSPAARMEGVTIRNADEAVCSTAPSCVYYFPEKQIEQLTGEAGFRIIENIIVPEVHRRFVTVERKLTAGG